MSNRQTIMVALTATFVVGLVFGAALYGGEGWRGIVGVAGAIVLLQAAIELWRGRA